MAGNLFDAFQHFFSPIFHAIDVKVEIARNARLTGLTISMNLLRPCEASFARLDNDTRSPRAAQKIFVGGLGPWQRLGSNEGAAKPSNFPLVALRTLSVRAAGRRERSLGAIMARRQRSRLALGVAMALAVALAAWRVAAVERLAPRSLFDVCDDRKPSGRHSCDEQKAWGKCDEQWFIDGKYCRKTCGKCVEFNPRTAELNLRRAMKQCALTDKRTADACIAMLTGKHPQTHTQMKIGGNRRRSTHIEN